MNCQRCNGLTVSDDSIVVQAGSSLDVHARRCINCGMIVDEVIHQNQQALRGRKTLGGPKFRRCGSEAA
ncbi:MAG TPA: hypothetical protein PKD12_21640 [Nitrospira sp.]|nr:hypothetical protein [Nitrospira sp.]